jgi:hypothetical protein
MYRQVSDEETTWAPRVKRTYWKLFLPQSSPVPPSPLPSLEDRVIAAAGSTGPTLDFRFAALRSLTNNAAGDSPIVFARASSASYFDADGTMQVAAIDEPRFDHDPVTGQCLGLLVEEARSNLLFNSAALANQTLPAAATTGTYTLSFYGRGIVRLTSVTPSVPGANVEVLLNAELAGPSERSSVTFSGMPAGDDIMVTVLSGAPRYAQLEVGAFATSWIPTDGSASVRALEAVTISGTPYTQYFLSRGLSYPTGTLYCAFSRPFDFDRAPAVRRAWTFYRGTTNNSVQLRSDSSLLLLTDRFLVVDGGSNTFSSASNRIPGPGVLVRSVASWDQAILRSSFNGSGATQDSLSLPFFQQPNTFSIGSYLVYGSHLCGHIRYMAFWTEPLESGLLTAMTAET